MDLCIGIKFCQKPDILSQVPSLEVSGLAVALESGTIMSDKAFGSISQKSHENKN